MDCAPYIQLTDICKSFGSVRANHNVCLDVRRGEIHALLGENGSGKSTLVNMLSGIYAPDSGQIVVDGRKRRFASPRDAIESGIGMVHQHFKLVDVMTAAENLALGARGGLFVNKRALAARMKALGARYGLTVDPERKVYNMSVGEKQTVEILKALYHGANVLILDEPTAVLTPQETKSLFEILRGMKAEGCSVIIITHKLGEVLEISDRVTVLRRGESVGTVETKDADARSLTELMVGRPVSLKIARPAVPQELKRPLLEVRGLSARGPGGVKTLDGMSFTLSGGEILGVAGIAGSGQKELCEIIRRGIQMSFIPEDRLGMGLVAGMDIVENVMLKTFRRGKTPFIDRSSGRRDAERIVRDYSIDTPSVGHIVKKLSGGNIQKVLLGREIDLNPTLLITAYPVRGLDIGASYFIYDALNKQKEKGVGILFIGEDLDVLMELCDRVMVIHGGAVMGIVDPAQVTKEDIGLMMLGHKPGEVVA